ncbi:hypothetical protein PFICI_11901 [Pestalotiopsis fici W106-1]|uniref:Uncharacterized protein n=1 Tax=Pestalotiopsis fici (strain W106-1 / CGMCC3.15140) TaxID=1229662 RepID=W3WRQ1_PESFW|nr:uncharacterized protein PFICI_11901 [Pestalotiopsis fici W106-1]ETS76514.1 hypothetical protein PFICI_11901 [Pestalotiopsis fici W106-1]
MDEHSQADGSPAPSPARTGRGGWRGRGGRYSGRGGRGGSLARKTTVAKRGGNRGRGRGRNKTYTQPRVQAAYERSKDLRELYSDVSSAMKPALERLAEHTLNQMIADPEFHTKVPEYAAVQNELDDRLKARLEHLESEEQLRRHMVEHKSEHDDIISTEKFNNGFDYKTDEFLDGVLNRLSILSELRRDGYGTNIPSPYTFVQKPDSVVDEQGPYVFHHPLKGHEVPYPHLLQADTKASALRTTLGRIKQKPGPKRKAEETGEGQPESKKLLGASFTSAPDSSTPRPRHIGGLLSAETELDGEPESNAPSPTPLEEGLSPESSQESSTSGKKEKDLPDLPTGASEPDQWGVRTVYKRGPKANNRIIIPCVFDFDDDDIGFRDSTNDSTRKATKNSRGRFLNKPNSRAWHLDQTIVTYNALDNKDGDLDPEIVKKHKVHPRFGFFLPESVNESEPPHEHVDTTRPIVVVTPNGTTLHASRSVRPKLMDQALRADAGKTKITAMMESLRKDMELEVDDITTPEIRQKQQDEQERQAELDKIAAAEEEQQQEEEESVDEYEQANAIVEERQVLRIMPSIIANDPRSNLTRQRGAANLISAATQLDEEDFMRDMGILSNPRASRPFDPVRNAFRPVHHPIPPRHHPVDTFGLSVLADMSELRSAGHMADPSMIDGRHAPLAPQPGFLQTALNPAPYASIAPAPQQSIEGRPPTPARNPFTGQSTGRNSPALPPLRPTRRDKGLSTGLYADGQPPYAASSAALAAGPPQPPPLKQEYDHAHGVGNGFYPPSSTHRPFHHGFPHPEPIPPIAPRQGPPVPAPLIIPSQQSHPSQHLPGYPAALSPTLPGSAPLASLLSHPMGPSSPALTGSGLPGPPGPLNSPTSSTPQSRGSISSNNGQQNSAKYRKIAAAPVPYSRQWPSNGGTELRLSNYDPKGAIKDYMANEPPPRTGPTTIRGWSVNNGQRNRGRAGSRKEGSVEDTESPK